MGGHDPAAVIVLTAIGVIALIAIAAWLFVVFQKPYDDDPEN